ncbi:MAG: tetraacyldisaccharide 4'-kinase [Comamonadaceae bacterium]|nr:MAG: tetraacyldisaccharide 4'-kinase [Comamonadaceae bacterium]
MDPALQRAWLQRGPLAWLLRPVSLLFGVLVALRRRLYRSGMLQAWHPGVPVVVVGNVVAGGAGKTPVVIALVDHLKALGLNPGVVSRGYGRRTSDCREVHAQSDASDVGDEPLLVATRCRVPVFVAPRRTDAVRALLAAHPATQVLVCDDGLQHYALARDVEICVFDERGVGNGWLLPAGPLREPWPRPVDLVLRTGPPNGIEGFGLRRQLADHAVRADGTRRPLAQLNTQPCAALAGIAQPQAFFAMLQDQGLTLASTEALPDHYDFDSYTAPPDVRTQLICTEKDAVKLWKRHPGTWAVPLVLQIEPAFWPAFDRALHAKLSSP